MASAITVASLYLSEMLYLIVVPAAAPAPAV